MTDNIYFDTTWDLGVHILGTKILISWPMFYFSMLISRPLSLKHLTQSKSFSIVYFTVSPERRVKVDAVVSVKW